MNNNYEDIINLEPPISKKHHKMPISARAAQFAPFSALTGYKEAIEETGRITEEEIFLDEDKKVIINEKLNTISKNLESSPKITLKKLFARQMEVIIDVMDQDALISKQEEMSKEMDAICNTIKVKLLKEERFAFAMDVIGFLAFFCVMAFEGVYQKVSFALDLYTIMAFTLVLFVDYLDSIRQERHNKIFENITEMTNNAFAFLEKKKWKTEGALHQ